LKKIIHTWAKRSPRNHPTREVHDLARSGWVSSASLYAAHPGTAPPLVKEASRKRGLTVAGAFCLSELETTSLFATFLDTVGPKACAVTQVAATRSVVSFIFNLMYLLFYKIYWIMNNILSMQFFHYLFVGI
jgi:hypothetical protein